MARASRQQSFPRRLSEAHGALHRCTRQMAMASASAVEASSPFNTGSIQHRQSAASASPFHDVLDTPLTSWHRQVELHQGIKRRRPRGSRLTKGKNTHKISRASTSRTNDFDPLAHIDALHANYAISSLDERNGLDARRGGECARSFDASSSSSADNPLSPHSASNRSTSSSS
jgi:hypothetical protein